jgi:hypothetical protein
MSFLQQALLLFLLNFFDAVLTVFWIRNGYATEGNLLMAHLLDIGDSPFLAVKFAIGAITAFVLWRCKDLKIAKYGLAFSLVIYLGLMAVHFLTGLSAAGYLSETFMTDLSIWATETLA